MVNNPYAVEELTHQHQAELEHEAAHAEFARAARTTTERPGFAPLFAGLIAGLRSRRRRLAQGGSSSPTHPFRRSRVHLPHRHAPAAR